MSDSISPTESQSIPEDPLRLASASKRFLAFLIDVLPLTVLIAALFYFFLGFDKIVEAHWADRQNVAAHTHFLVQRTLIRNLVFVVYIAYSALMESSSYAGSFGKHLLGVEVVNLYGQPLSRSQAWGRNLAKLLSFVPLFLGAFWILFDKRNQTWHDKAAKTLVVTR